MAKKIIKFVVAVVFAVGLVLVPCGINGVFTSDLPQYDVVKYLSDGFFVSAVVMLGAGGLTWASRMGTFDGLGYTFSVWMERFTNHKRDWHKKEDFQEYKERKAEKKKGNKFNYLLVMGGVLMLVAVALVLAYNFAF